MKSIQITEEELSKVKKQYIGEGATSVVCKFSNDLVLKIFKKEGIQLFEKGSLSQLMGIENDTCVFPKDYAKIGNAIIGYTMDFVNGAPLERIIKQININELLNAIGLVEKDLHGLESRRILFDDLNQGGIMWDEDKRRMRIIDTDFFQINEDLTGEQCYKTNSEAFNSLLLMELGILNGQENALLDYLNKHKDYCELDAEHTRASISGENLSITELIKKIVEIVNKEFGVTPNNFEEIEQLVAEHTNGQQKTEPEDLSIPTFTPPTGEKKPSSFDLDEI